jgi:hypothetical protein
LHDKNVQCEFGIALHSDSLIFVSLDPEPPCISSCFSSRQTVSAITTTLVALERQLIAELGERAVDGHDIGVPLQRLGKFECPNAVLIGVLTVERLQVLKLTIAVPPDFPTHNAEVW